MNDATLIANDAKVIVQAHLDRLGEPKDHHLSPEVKQAKFAQIKEELKNAMLFWWHTIIAIQMFRNWQRLQAGACQIHLKWRVLAVTTKPQLWSWQVSNLWEKPPRSCRLKKLF